MQLHMNYSQMISLPTKTTLAMSSRYLPFKNLRTARLRFFKMNRLAFKSEKTFIKMLKLRTSGNLFLRRTPMKQNP